MLKGVNDTAAHARELARLLKDLPCKINLIPFNPFPKTRYETSTQKDIDKFGEILIKQGYVVVTRRTRGDDIDAACGQLKTAAQKKSRAERDREAAAAQAE